MKLVVDVETNGIENPTKCWCVCTFDVDSNEAKEWTHEDGFEGCGDYLGMADQIIGHNFLSFDARYLKLLCGINVPEQRILDTLVLSRLYHYAAAGGHSLEAWGGRLGHEKTGLDVDFSCYSPDILLRCRNDVALNVKVYEFLKKKVLDKDTFKEAVDVEHRMAIICRDMHDSGFGFDYDGARSIHSEISKSLGELDTAILAAFPPRAKFIREVTPRLTQHGTLSKVGLQWVEDGDLSKFASDSPFSLVKWEPFNPGSVTQIVERLNQAGWSPRSKTEGHKRALLGIKKRGHNNPGVGKRAVFGLTPEDKKKQIARMKIYGWKVDEVNIATLPETAPAAAKLLVKRILLAARLRTLDEWMGFYNDTTKSIHGQFYSIGTVSHRMAHRRPNLGNVATKKTIKYNSPELRHLAIEYGGRMRALWRAREGCLLVGTDMESAHLRIFAHLIDDPEFTQSLLTGRKEDGTDPHSVNKRKLGDICQDRDRAKTFIFSFLNGAAAPKVASIFDCSLQRAAAVLGEFAEAYPGLQRLKRDVMPADAARGYFVGLDGRWVACKEERLLIGMYLQNAESVIMKHANLEWQDEVRRRGISCRQVNLVHDEFVTEVSGTSADCNLVGQLQCDAISHTGRLFQLKCPLAGEYKVGKNWLEVH